MTFYSNLQPRNPLTHRHLKTKTSSKKNTNMHQPPWNPHETPQKKLLTCQGVFSNNKFHTTLQEETSHELQITLVRVFRLSFVVEFFWGSLGEDGFLWVANLPPPTVPCWEIVLRSAISGEVTGWLATRFALKVPSSFGEESFPTYLEGSALLVPGWCRGIGVHLHRNGKSL